MAVVQLSRAEVEAALGRWGLVAYRTLDSWYWCADLPYWDIILASVPPPPKWYAEVQDCDDIAEWFREECRRRFHLKPGVIINDTHVFNIAVLADGALQLMDAMWSDGWVVQVSYVEPGSSLHELAGARVWM